MYQLDKYSIRRNQNGWHPRSLIVQICPSQTLEYIHYNMNLFLSSTMFGSSAQNLFMSKNVNPKETNLTASCYEHVVESKTCKLGNGWNIHELCTLNARKKIMAIWIHNVQHINTISFEFIQRVTYFLNMWLDWAFNDEFGTFWHWVIWTKLSKQAIHWE